MKLQAYVLPSLLALLITASVSCKKDPDDNKPVPVKKPVTTAVFVLNQGLYSGNNASVTMLNKANDSITNDYFSTQNNRALGDTGFDLLVYGSKAYITTNVSSQLEIVDAKSFASIKQISFIENEIPLQPTGIAAWGNYIFVAAYNGTVTVIDTASLLPVKTIPVGLNPESVLAAYDKIWVSNSGGMSFPDYDNSVSVIDPITLTEENRIVVGTNPFTLQADGYGDIYVITRGNYADEKMRLRIIDAEKQILRHTFEDMDAYNFTLRGDTAFLYYYDFMGTGSSKIMTVNVKTDQLISDSFITDGTVIQTPYGIFADPYSGDVYICDARGFVNSGLVYCFAADGKLKHSFTAGMNPTVVRFMSAQETKK